jgi:hypothetical protein
MKNLPDKLGEFYNKGWDSRTYTERQTDKNPGHMSTIQLIN